MEIKRKFFPTPSNEYAIYDIYLNGFPIMYFYDKVQKEESLDNVVTTWFNNRKDELMKTIKHIAVVKHNYPSFDVRLDLFNTTTEEVINYNGDRVTVPCYNICLSKINPDGINRFIPLLLLKDVSNVLNRDSYRYKL